MTTDSKIDFELFHTEEEDLREKKAVLLFHGLTGSPFEMKKYGNFLFKQGYDVFCYSFPGHGERLSEIQTVTWEDWCEFAQEKYDKLRPNYETFFVSGLCLGAAMGIYLAENNKDLTGVAALSTTLFLDGFCIPWTSCLIPLGLSTIIRYYYTFPEDECLGIKNELTRKSLAKLMAKTTVGMDNYPLNGVKGLLDLSKNVRKNLSKVTCPVLCIHSKYDNLASTKSANVVMKNISSKIKRYIELNDSYHMVLYDNEKEFVMNEVIKFLSKFSAKTLEKESAKI
ncbi:MAG: alpha/beta hydrolase [Candidatus Gastranaerophilales bacterium]|nr:alpha/beta hydrolase [Candidatus Gastranaerophilales bacterium]